jgi:Uma2 family endonuclease
MMKASEMLRRLRRDDWWGGPGEIVVVPLGRPATTDDLKITKLKAEIVDGQLLVIGPSACATARAGGSILISLDQYRNLHGGGYPFGAKLAYIIDLPHRQAISPDVSWYTGSRWGAGFPRGAPAFAAEVREVSEYGEEAERRMAAKRADYFAAGTRVVWDVDVLREGVVRVYRADDPEHPTVYGRGEVAEAEPAVPGWGMPVDELFE